MYLFQVSGWLEYENEEHNGADVLKSQQTAISDTETSCLSLQIKPLNRELHWRSHYPDGSHMIYRGGGAALALICEQVLVKLPSLPPIRWICGWRGGELHLSTWCPRSGMPPGTRKGEVGPAEATSTCLPDLGSIVLGSAQSAVPVQSWVKTGGG